ncbi:hypothetical protein ACWGJ2_30230 [Streptomyces sp. NPDC054796]
MTARAGDAGTGAGAGRLCLQRGIISDDSTYGKDIAPASCPK